SFRRVLLLLRDRVAAGTSLADAMAEQPAVFDELCVNLVRVGEDAGTLDATLLRLASFKERSRQFKGKLATALLYPAIVRLAVVMSTLLKSGVVFVRALQIAQHTTSNRVLRQALLRCEAAVAAGGDIAVALEATAAFPPLVLHLFALGQQSGRLEEML